MGGTGRGDFQPGSDFTVASQGKGVATADVDGDGDLDLLATTFDAGVSIRLNGGDASGSNTGKFSRGQDVAVGSGPASVAVGDLDGDGDLDLLTANGGSTTVSVRINGGMVLLAAQPSAGRTLFGVLVPKGRIYTLSTFLFLGENSHFISKCFNR